METNKDLLNSFYLAFCKSYRMTTDDYRELIKNEIPNATSIDYKELHQKLMQLKEKIMI